MVAERSIRNARYLRRTFELECTMFDLARNTLTAGVAALALGAAALSAGPAQAGASTGTWRNGMQAGPGGVGCYDQGCAARNYGYGQPGYGYRHGHSGYRPVQAYPAYRSHRSYGDCFVESRRSTNRWGEVVIRRVRVCE
jgi:hypothetical protein